MPLPNTRPENPHETYVMRVLLALDRLLNALSGGDDRETVSERTGRYLGENSLADALAVFLDMLDPGHVVDVLDDLTPEQAVALRAKLAEVRACVPAPAPRDQREYQAP